MEFRILGPLEVIDDGGRSVEMGRSRERTLLGRLLVSANRLVPCDLLIDDLWGEEPPQGAVHALRVSVSRLRRTLRDVGMDSVIVTRPPGYLVCAEPGALDSARFETLVAQGRDQAVEGRPGVAADTFTAALSLWRGPALADLLGAPWATVEAVRLEEARLTATEERIDADLARGRHGPLVAELDALIRAHPLRERLWAQRMLALYRAGRQAEAVRAYQELRTVLGEELGLAPTPVLVRLEGAILRHEPELDWHPPTVSPASPRPEASDRGGRAAPGAERTPYVGRQRERAELRRLLDQAAQGAGGLVMIGGEPGVGKTRPAEELLAEAALRQMQTFAGHSYEMEGAPPYIAFVQIFEHALAGAPSPAAFRHALGDEAAEITRLLPNLRRLYPDIPAPLDLPAGQDRHMLFNSVRQVLARTAQRCPVLLVLDDLHWADDSSLLLLEHLAERLFELPILVIATYRDHELDVGRPLAKTFEDLRRRRLARWMTLERLPAEAVGEMLRALCGEEAPAALVVAFQGRTEGNPFFVEEVYKHLVEEGKLFDGAGRFRPDLELVDLDVPPGVRLVLGRRLRRLSPDAHRGLVAAAVVGRTFSFEQLEAMTDVDPEVLLDVIEEVRRTGLIVPSADASGEDRFIFAHELIRQSLYVELSLTRRRRLHARAAVGLERRYADDLDRHAAGIAHHLLEAGPAGDHRRAGRYLIRAGNWAADSAAFEEAVRHYERALGLSDAIEPGEQAVVLFHLAVARRSAGHWDAAIDAFAQSFAIGERLGNAELVARVALAMTYTRAWMGRFGEAVKVAERGLSALGEEVSAERGRLLAMMGAWAAASGRYEQSAAAIDEALRFADRLNDDLLLGHSLAGKSLMHFFYMEFRQAVEEGRRAAASFRAAGDPRAGVYALTFVLHSLPYLGLLDEARRVAEDLKPLAERLGDHGALEVVRRTGALVEFFVAPDLDRLEAFAHHDRRESGASGMPWLSHSWTWQGLAQFLRGKWTEAKPLFEEAARLEIPPPSAITGFDAALLFECLAYLGERSEALALLDATPLPRPGQRMTWGAGNMLVSAVEGLTVMGERDRAAALYPSVISCLERTETVCMSYIDGRLLERTAGIAAMAGRRWKESETHFRHAVAQAESIPHRLEEAHTCRFYAQMLLGRNGPGDRAQAQTLATRAAASYSAIGMRRHLKMADDLLAETAAHGVSTRRKR